MLDSVFSSLYATSTTLTFPAFCLSLAAALLLGTLLTAVYTYQNTYTKGFAVTLAMLPAIVAIVILMVNGSLGASVAVAGTFSLVRFRSVPGTAKEIGAIFLAMAVGLACGMGYPAFAALFTVVMAAAELLYTKLGLWEQKRSALSRTLQITVPEDLNYAGAFDDLFEKYTTGATLLKVKTTNLGSLNRLTYDIALKQVNTEKELIDELRCRNGNLEISAALPTLGSEAL
ncbi:DUF4956 domain-containing protein [Oscillibacter sp.]|uniref:DUF4956 domain-containing protein n=1 Tax=Oscillibacter sp. TaxID=1945593 RepID=UPI00260F91B9|nr:DUF4956 domain-containing protein [Oscillibacter sp.]MDD3347822.1 DUF4956 domain-containing protein [Oscillibacter sp.]